MLILGVGNALFSDDGFGPEVAARLLSRYRVPEGACVLDVGTGARRILFTLALSDAHPDEIVLVDAVDGGIGDWRVAEIPLEALPSNKTDDFSLHQVPASNLLVELRDRGGMVVTVLACDVGLVPPEIRPGLSPPAKEAVERAAALIAARFAWEPNNL